MNPSAQISNGLISGATHPRIEHARPETEN
jgi:hypothetical protein